MMDHESHMNEVKYCVPDIDDIFFVQPCSIVGSISTRLLTTRLPMLHALKGIFRAPNLLLLADPKFSPAMQNRIIARQAIVSVKSAGSCTPNRGILLTGSRHIAACPEIFHQSMSSRLAYAMNIKLSNT